MVTPRKLHPKQRGRKSALKTPAFAVIERQNDHQQAEDDQKLLKFIEAFDDSGIEPVKLTDEQMSDLNLTALHYALMRTLAEPDRHDQVTAMLEEDGWSDAAQFSAYHQQIRILGLRPWQSPPCALGIDAHRFDEIIARRDPVGDYAAVLLTKAMIRNGVSVYEANPVEALEQAVQRARRAVPR
jgi:hypothetical protein